MNTRRADGCFRHLSSGEGLQDLRVERCDWAASAWLAEPRLVQEADRPAFAWLAEPKLTRG
jgi:hypothetical protein